MYDDTIVTRLNIQEDDIAYAIAQDRYGCAIVRSVQRALPEATHVVADKNVIKYSIGGHRYTHDTPDIAIKNVIQPLDEHKEVSPCVLFLPPPTVEQRKVKTPEENTKHRNDMRQAKRRKGTQEQKPSPVNHTTNRFCDPSTEIGE